MASETKAETVEEARVRLRRGEQAEADLKRAYCDLRIYMEHKSCSPEIMIGPLAGKRRVVAVNDQDDCDLIEKILRARCDRFEKMLCDLGFAAPTAGETFSAEARDAA